MIKVGDKVTYRCSQNIPTDASCVSEWVGKKGTVVKVIEDDCHVLMDDDKSLETVCWYLDECVKVNNKSHLPKWW